MSKSSPTPLHLITSIAILPVNVLFTIPAIIIFLTKSNAPNFIAIQTNWILLPIGILTLAAGVTLMWQTISLFYKKGKGTLAPWKPTQNLVIEGPYRYVRNPMISGVLCILTAEGLILKSVFILYWALFFFTINYVYFILKEEPDLLKRFGEDYKIYKENVPRWIPRSTPWNNKN